jgi:hypothetical protein
MAGPSPATNTPTAVKTRSLSPAHGIMVNSGQFDELTVRDLMRQAAIRPKRRHEPHSAGYYET